MSSQAHATAHRRTRIALLFSAAGLFLAAALPAAAETELSFYGGVQSAGASKVKGANPAIGSFNKMIHWEGKSFAAPPYYGARATFWQNSAWGFGVEYSHDKVYAPKSDMEPEFSHLEFTDGLNIVTVNAARRWMGALNGATPYVLAGVGVAIPHVEVTPTGGEKTEEYQFTGPAMRLTAGIQYPMTDHWSVFGEYQFTASDNSADLKGGGTLDTKNTTNALNLGVSFRF